LNDQECYGSEKAGRVIKKTLRTPSIADITETEITRITRITDVVRTGRTVTDNQPEKTRNPENNDTKVTFLSGETLAEVEVRCEARMLKGYNKLMDE
jgi:hypothetical protein